MSHKMLRPFIVKVSVLGYFPLSRLDSTPSFQNTTVHCFKLF